MVAKLRHGALCGGSAGSGRPGRGGRSAAGGRALAGRRREASEAAQSGVSPGSAALGMLRPPRRSADRGRASALGPGPALPSRPLPRASASTPAPALPGAPLSGPRPRARGSALPDQASVTSRPRPLWLRPRPGSAPRAPDMPGQPVVLQHLATLCSQLLVVGALVTR